MSSDAPEDGYSVGYRPEDVDARRQFIGGSDANIIFR
jgi:hypothetical protein